MPNKPQYTWMDMPPHTSAIIQAKWETKFYNVACLIFGALNFIKLLTIAMVRLASLWIDK